MNSLEAMRVNACKGPVDYNEEARKLFRMLNLPETGAATEASTTIQGMEYRDLDAVWQHPETGARVFIGNQTASRTRAILQRNNITHIVNCTDDMVNVFEGKDNTISYFRFDLYQYYSKLDLNTHKGVLKFFAPVFRWIDEATASGCSVLVHCLAGAHRAGTTGTAYTMHASSLDHATAIKACKSCRPAVDPMGDLTDLLAQLEVAQRHSTGYLVEA